MISSLMPVLPIMMLTNMKTRTCTTGADYGIRNNERTMKRLVKLAIALTPTFFLPSANADELQVGSPAPKFALLDQHSREHRLEDYQGRWLVLYFYPKADTPGCTTEACNFRDDVFQFRKMNVALLGISTDDVSSQKEFAEKYHLPFSLLSDPDGTVAGRYGSFTKFGPVRFASRHSFIIDPAGRIAKIYRDVSPARHSKEVIADLEVLAAGDPEKQ